jgi:hypothetical protein
MPPTQSRLTEPEAPAKFVDLAMRRLLRPLANQARLGLFRDARTARQLLERGIPPQLEPALLELVLADNRKVDRGIVARLRNPASIRLVHERGVSEYGAFTDNPFTPPDVLLRLYRRDPHSIEEDRIQGDRAAFLAAVGRRRNVANLRSDLHRMGPTSDGDVALRKAGEALTRAGAQYDSDKSQFERFDWGTIAYKLTPDAASWICDVPLFYRGCPLDRTFFHDLANGTIKPFLDSLHIPERESLGHWVDSVYAAMTNLATEPDRERFLLMLHYALGWMGRDTVVDLALVNPHHVKDALTEIDFKQAANDCILAPAVWLNVLRHDPSLLAQFEGKPSGLEQLVDRDVIPAACADLLSEEQLVSLLA